ncbi:alkanal monooxygenase alpha chain domain protein [Mycobacterium ulcerans str. Harvey]|uniref:Alkanal monooxygenase alpha chain domain protein n=1 Tax=Mycobacterium ulcerans str. Harvey TaxID=1299332 RepID=A0ABP3A936_MYCUL|nr:alkanal monooxygenase alpha chain domain protein [Mycobacterium ulcerans str. Harvey]
MPCRAGAAMRGGNGVDHDLINTEPLTQSAHLLGGLLR